MSNQNICMDSGERLLLFEVLDKLRTVRDGSIAERGDSLRIVAGLLEWHADDIDKRDAAESKLMKRRDAQEEQLLRTINEVDRQLAENERRVFRREVPR